MAKARCCEGGMFRPLAKIFNARCFCTICGTVWVNGEKTDQKLPLPNKGKIEMADKINDGGRAYPSTEYVDAPEIGAHTIAGNTPREATIVHHWGMSLREYFTGQVLASLSDDVSVKIPKESRAQIAKTAVAIADATIKELGL